ncbi:MAG: prolipoprotein diacylglyceryl transferase [Planctomycetes bacterium]|nr:prolipoprotein diacylglyceryl transferase [Planctomycetota bacterium]
MHPILFTIPGIEFHVRSFGVMLAIGFLVGSWVFTKLVEQRLADPKKDLPRYAPLPVWILIGIVLGARLLYVIVEVSKGSPVGHDYVDKPWTVLFVWEGGLVMYGGLFGGMLAGSWCCFINDIKIPGGMDLGLIAGFVGYGIGRIGCFLVGDDYGAIVPAEYASLPFPVVLHVPNPLPEHSLFGAENAGQVLWATQPWMSINGFFLALLGWFLLKHRAYRGQVSLILIAGYALDRSIIEHFRGDTVRGVWFGGAISTSQLISIGAGTLALVMLVVFAKRRDPELI